MEREHLCKGLVAGTLGKLERLCRLRLKRRAGLYLRAVGSH